MQNLFPKLSLPSAFTFSITGFFNCLHMCTLNWGKQKTKYKFDSAPSFMSPAAKLMPKLAALVCSQQYRTRQSIPFTAVHRIKHWQFRGEKSWVPAAARRQSQSRLCLAVVSSQEGLGLPVGAVLPLWSTALSGWFTAGNRKIHAGISSNPSLKHIFLEVPQGLWDISRQMFILGREE